MTQYRIQSKQDTVSKALDDLNEVFKDSSSFEGYCNRKQNQLKLNFSESTDNEQIIWDFIRSMSQNPDEVLQKLGYNKNDIIKLAEQYTGKIVKMLCRF